MKPSIAVYTGQSLAPPDQKGLTAGSGLWCQIGNVWYRIEDTTSLFKVAKKLTETFNLREWPFKEVEPK